MNALLLEYCLVWNILMVIALVNSLQRRWGIYLDNHNWTIMMVSHLKFKHDDYQMCVKTVLQKYYLLKD